VQKESLHFATILSTYFCWIEGAWAEVVVVAVSVLKTGKPKPKPAGLTG
jgi:hypothetical protein